MEWWEILLAIVFGLVFIPIFGGISGALIMLVGGAVEALFKKGDEWAEEYGEIKSLYAVSFIIGAVVLFLIYGYYKSSS